MQINDLPFFHQIVGYVLENEVSGQRVLRVSATDRDDSTNNQIVSYWLDMSSSQKGFSIDANNGWISTTKSFDREVRMK